MSKKKFLSFLLLGLILISFYVLLSNLPSAMRAFAGFITSAFTTFFLGIILAFILNIPASFFENKIAGTKIRLLAKSSRGAGIILSLVIQLLLTLINQLMKFSKLLKKLWTKIWNKMLISV